jgi:RNA polymerase sigma-70 factor (sigma-E family)
VSVEQEVRVREEDEPADFAGWVASRGAALQRFAFLVTGSADEAPDLVQDALMRAYPRWAALSIRGTAEAYVRRSIVNASISGWRKSRRFLSVADPEPLIRVTRSEPAHDDADEAWLLCAELPTTQRAAVVLRFYEDLSYAQIAVILDCPESTVRSHVHRALKSLRERLSESEATDV